MGGTAIWRASDEIIAKGIRIAAEALEAAEADIRFADGSFVVTGTDRGLPLLARYTAVDDYGVLVNPMIAAGQAHGAIAQGVGQALLEHAVYDPGSGQVIAGSLMDYALLRADDLPFFDLGFNPTRCTTNPLGVKGCGEAGAVAGFPAVADAILDALVPLGITELAGLATHERICAVLGVTVADHSSVRNSR